MACSGSTDHSPSPPKNWNPYSPFFNAPVKILLASSKVFRAPLSALFLKLPSLKDMIRVNMYLNGQIQWLNDPIIRKM